MPYDGDVREFEQVTKPEVFSLEGLRDWLKTMPADGAYNYWNCDGGCLLGLYLIARGQPEKRPHSEFVRRFGGGSPFGIVALEHPRTFGAALQRCEAALTQCAMTRR
jgi:hypothetical protein